MKIQSILAKAFAIFVSATAAHAATMSASSTAPIIDDADIANYGVVSTTDKWFLDAARGQSITTGGAAVRLKAISYQVSEGNGAAPTKTYALRVGKVAGNNFTQVHSETATQNFSWTGGQFMTWTFATPVLLEPYTTYGIDVGMLTSTSVYQTGIPYINVTADEYAGGTSYASGTSGVGNSALSSAIATDRIFHLDIERPLGPVFSLVVPSPADNATDAYASREIVMTFSQNVTPGTGNLTIRNLTNGTDTTLAANDSRLTYDQNVVRINPTGLLTWSKNYAIRIDAGMFLGDAAAPIAAISDDTTWNFTTIAADPLLAAIAALKAHVLNTSPLTGPQISAHKTTIDNQRQRLAETTEIINAVFNLISTYDTAKGPLFVSGSNVTSFDRNTTSISPENYHWVIYTVMQHTMDLIYTGENLAKYESTLLNYKFGSHTSFPGPCSPPASPTNTHSVQINGSFPATFGRLTQMWTTPARKPTGTYLAPGTVATVTVPLALVNAGYKVRVGAHSWDLSTRRPVNRLERATRLFSITSTTTKIASPYGGGIYIEVPYLANAGVVSVTVTGGVRAPYFSQKSFHQTTLAEWNIEKTHPAPWADFQSDKFMTQVPRKWVYNHPNPTVSMTAWDASMDAINNLMGFPLIRGKETMYCHTDVILRSSVHAPGYPAVNVTSNVNSEVSPTGYAGNYLVRGPGENPPAANIEFHEQGHAYGFPKFGGESESNVNLLQPAMLNRAFGTSFNVAQAASLGSTSAARTLDNTAVAWMCVFNFSPREVPMADGEKAYQHKGHAKYMDIARLFGWDKLDTFWRSFMQDDANNISYGGSTDDFLLRLSKSVGADIRPLFHFWGIHPQNPASLAAAIAAANPPLPASNVIRLELLRYKGLVPANNAAFRTFASAWWGKQPSIGGAWEEREHSRQWDTAALYGPGDQQRSEATNPGEIYNENSANDIRNRVDELIALYYPGAITPNPMTFVTAPTVVDATTIGMTATTATAGTGPIQYYFDETSGNSGGDDSGWQTSPTYQDSGLTSGLTYTYRVKARDGALSETDLSTASNATPTSSGDITPPSPSPMTFATPPNTVDVETITMTASTATDINGVEYYFENTTSSTNSGWQDSPVYTETNLSPATPYTYRVRARDKSANQNLTTFSATATANTGNLPDETPPQVVSFNPADAAVVSSLASNLVVTFDEPILEGVGSVTLKNLTDATEVVFNIEDTAITVAGSSLTLNPPTDLLYEKSYAVQISNGAVADVANNPFIGINNDETWSFATVLAAPIPSSGGPYLVPVAGSLSLNGSAVPSTGATLSPASYAWDLNRDNVFGDVTGATPTAITDAVLMATYGMVLGQNSIKLKVTDSLGTNTTVTTIDKIGVNMSWDANATGNNLTDGAGTWLNANQWRDNGVNSTWVSGSSPVFGVNGTGGAISLTANTTVGLLAYNAFNGTYTISGGGVLTVNNGLTNNSSSGSISMVVPVILGAAQIWGGTSTGSLTSSGGINTNGHTLTIGVPGTVDMDAGGNVISGSGGITKNGNGRMFLGSSAPVPAHTYTGTTTINGGSIMFSGNLGTGNLTITSGYHEYYFGGTFTRTLGSGVGQVQILGGACGFSNNGSNGSTVRLNNNASYEVVWGSTFFNPSTLLLQAPTDQNSSTVNFDNKLDLNGATRTISVASTTSGAGSSTLAQIVRNSSATTPAGLIKSGSGRLNLNNANTYNGGTTVQAGTLQLGNTTGLGASSGPLTVNGGLLNLNDQTVSIGNLSGTGGTIANNGGGARTLTIGSGDGTGGTYQGVIANNSNAGTGTIALTKTGSGTITLAGTNTYSGATAISGGTLAITGSLGATAVTVSSPATLSGNGNIGGNVTVNSGARHALAVAATPAAQVTRAITGTLTLTSGNILDLTAAAPPAAGVYVLATATTAITGTPTTINSNIVNGVISVDTTSTPKRLLLTVSAGNTYAAWIAGYPGAAGMAGFTQDADNDGIENGIENFFGTNPTTATTGLLAGTKNANTFTFSHPQNTTPANGVTASYRWTKDLATFHPDGATDGANTTVVFTTQLNTPTPGITTVIATVTGTPTTKLLVDVKVTQN